MEERFELYQPDMEAIHHGFRTEPCFVCRIVAGDVRFPENIINEDASFLVFLDGYPRAYGYTLVAPKEHREQVTGDFTIDECLRLQRLVYRVTEAVRDDVGAERMYIFTFGSNGGNSHVPGTPCRCRPVCPTRISRARGQAGARAYSTFPKRRWLRSPNASGRG